MNNTNNPENQENNFENNSLNNLDTFSEVPGMERVGSKPMGKLISELSMMAMQKRGDGLDLTKFSKDQVDKLLDTAAKNEDNAYSYHSKRLDVYKDLESKKISASIADEKTKRFMYMAGLVIAAILTLIIILWKNEFFVPWITFITGSLGGFGIGKSQSKSNKQEISSSSSLLDDDE